MQQEIPPEIDDYGTSPIRGKIHVALNQVKWVLLYMQDVQSMRVPAALQALTAAKQLRRYAYALERTFDEAAVAEMHQTEEHEYIGDGFEAKLHDGMVRKEWRHESLVNEVGDRCVEACRDMVGDVTDREMRRIVHAALAHITTAGRVEWRSTGLRELGIDPDEFSVKRPSGSLSVELRGEASYATDAPRPQTRRTA